MAEQWPHESNSNNWVSGLVFGIAAEWCAQNQGANVPAYDEKIRATLAAFPEPVANHRLAVLRGKLEEIFGDNPNGFGCLNTSVGEHMSLNLITADNADWKRVVEAFYLYCST